MGHRKTEQEKLDKEIGNAFKGTQQVGSIGWRLANKSARASEPAEEKRQRRTSQDARQAIVLAERQEWPVFMRYKHGWKMRRHGGRGNGQEGGRT